MLDLHNDEPALVDVLDRESLIKEVGDAIAHCTPPQVFGVHGGWGLGKTSFLHQVHWYLTDNCPQQSEQAIEAAKQSTAGQERGKHKNAIQTVWFDAWRYQNDDAPVIALLHEMRAQLSWKSRTRKAIGRKVEVATRGALLSLEDLTKKIGFQYSKLRQATREWESENLAVALPSHTLREHLCIAISNLLPEEESEGVSPKLVVFIDDIDRCEPEAAYRLLECLKIYLTLDNCVFLIGMNQKVVKEAIAQRMHTADEENPTMRATEYMEKMCQNVWRLPTIRNSKEVLYGLLEKTVTNVKYRDSIKQGLEKCEGMNEETRGASHLLPPNPRKLKGLANLIGRLTSRLLSEEQHESGNGDDRASLIREAQLLTVVAYIYQFHHDIYVRWEADLSLYNEIFDWCRGVVKDDEHTFLKALALPYAVIEQPGDAPLGTGEMRLTIKPAYRDPEDANVFWIQLLILDLGSEVAPQNFGRYLHGVD